jgi:cytochrome P450
VTETANGPYHQLVLMKHSSIFINDSVEAVRVLNTLPEKGPIYDIFRYDKKVPDTLASDGDDWKQRSTYLRSALMNTKVLDTDLAPILKQFDLKLNEYAESGKPLDLNEIITLLSMDVVTKSVFQYDLNALSGSEEGARLYKCLTTLSDYQASQGPYANPKIKKVTQEEIKAVTTDWRKFLNKLVKVLQSEARIYKNLHGNLNHENSFIHALVNYMQQQSKFGEDEMLAEIHQAFRHGHECLAGTLLWACYSLYKNPYVRFLVHQ